MRIRDWSSDGCSSDLLGAKTSWFDGALVVDMTGFYIDWKNIPLQVQDRLGLFKYLDNVGDARIYGVETSLAVRPAHFVTLRSAITWNKATLQNFYDPQNRSEEHTSELQSLMRISYAVFCLKKKTQQIHKKTQYN